MANLPGIDEVSLLFHLLLWPKRWTLVFLFVVSGPDAFRFLDTREGAGMAGGRPDRPLRGADVIWGGT